MFVYLQEPVERDPSDENVGEELAEWKEGKDDPVHEPLGVVRLARALQGLDRAIRGVNEADEITQELGAIAKHQPEGGQSDDSYKKQAWIKDSNNLSIYGLHEHMALLNQLS